MTAAVMKWLQHDPTMTTARQACNWRSVTTTPHTPIADTATAAQHRLPPKDAEEEEEEEEADDDEDVEEQLDLALPGQFESPAAASKGPGKPTKPRKSGGARSYTQINPRVDSQKQSLGLPQEAGGGRGHN